MRNVEPLDRDRARLKNLRTGCLDRPVPTMSVRLKSRCNGVQWVDCLRIPIDEYIFVIIVFCFSLKQTMAAAGAVNVHTDPLLLSVTNWKTKKRARLKQACVAAIGISMASAMPKKKNKFSSIIFVSNFEKRKSKCSPYFTELPSSRGGKMLEHSGFFKFLSDFRTLIRSDPEYSII